MPAVRTPVQPRARIPAGARLAALNDPEVALMLRVQEGDSSAFAELVDHHRRRVFDFLYRRLCDHQEAEDLVQEVFLRLYRYRDRYQPRAKFSTWLFHVAQNVARNAIRSRRRHPTVRLPSFRPEEPGPADDCLTARGDDPSWPMERAELAHVVRSAVSGLGHRQRTALELHQFEDRTYAEVAAEMAMTPKAAKSLLYRARHQLRLSLERFV